MITAVLALQAKMQKELSMKLSRERNEEARAEQGVEGAYTNAMQVLENTMQGQQTGFDRNTDFYASMVVAAAPV